MQTIAMRKLSVWLDEMAPRSGAFAHALEWATRLGLPLRAVVPPREALAETMTYELKNSKDSRGQPTPYAVTPETIEACKAACIQKGLAWDVDRWQGPLAQAVRQFLRPAELCVFDDSLSIALKDELFRNLSSIRTSVLFCPRSGADVTRVLILNQPNDYSSCFLDTTAQLCLVFQIRPLVLTVAHSEATARVNQDFAEDLLACYRIPADFDFVVSGDLGKAISCVARLRRCTHVFIEMQQQPTWLHGLRWNTMERIFSSTNSLTFLVLPETNDPTILSKRIFSFSATDANKLAKDADSVMGVSEFGPRRQ